MSCQPINSNHERQTRINFYVNICAFVANIVVGIYYTPYLVNHLGLAAYGIIPLALIINQYISVATGTLTSAFTRFYSIDIQKGLSQQASKTLTTSLLVIALIILLCLPFLVYLIVKITTFFDIPVTLIQSARYLFIFTILSFFISLITSLLNVTLYALNRIDLITILNCIRTISKFLVTIILFEAIAFKVEYVGLAGLLTELGIFLCSVYLFNRFKPREVVLKWYNYDKVILYAILGMSTWVLLQQLGDTFIYRSDNLIINHYFGTEASGAVGVVTEFGSYIRIIVNVIGSLFGPLILLAYGENNHGEVKRLSVQQTLIVGCLAAVISGVISGFSYPLLSIWINPEFVQYRWWLVIKMIVVPYYAAGGILAFLYRTWNKVKLPAILTLILGLINLITIVIVAKFGNIEHSIMVILAVTSLISIVQCYLVNLFIVQKIYKEVKMPLMVNTIKIALSFIVAMSLSLGVSNYGGIHNAITLCLYAAICAILAFTFVFFFFWEKDDRRSLLSLIMKR